ncbi:MAG: DUF3396 domain-containing protein [Enterobacteriaceae bacterium]|jgi:hypothetical protein|nr:DUF3396 domain-containing protein [Enterobacteriaceae bacterium]
MNLNYIEKWLPEATVNYKDGRPAVGFGLIITVFFRNGHLPEVRQKMMESVDRFYGEFKPYMKKQMAHRWGGITEKNYAKYRQEIIDSTPEEIFSWHLTSATEDYLAPDYEIRMIGLRIFHNESNLSVIKLTFPFSFLKQSDGYKRYQEWLLWLCNEFEVESGYGGLSFVLPQEFYNMFPYEYALAQRFSGVMVDSIGILEGGHAVDGIKGACWYTILGNPWLEKLGGEDRLKRYIKDTPDITLLPYNNGMIIKAGELPPSLGEINTEELPPLLVKVNQIIKPIRLKKDRSLHFYSMEENLQFDEESTAKWYARFDEASALLSEPDFNTPEQKRITAQSGEISPHTGLWGTLVNGSIDYAQVKQGQPLPEFEDKHGKFHQTVWSLLERDDKGSVYIDVV